MKLQRFRRLRRVVLLRRSFIKVTRQRSRCRRFSPPPNPDPPQWLTVGGWLGGHRITVAADFVSSLRTAARELFRHGNKLPLHAVVRTDLLAAFFGALLIVIIVIRLLFLSVIIAVYLLDGDVCHLSVACSWQGWQHASDKLSASRLWQIGRPRGIESDAENVFAVSVMGPVHIVKLLACGGSG